MEIWKCEPVYKDYIWGGKKLKKEYHVKTESERVAESWVFSVHFEGSNRIINGKYKGKLLDVVLKDKTLWGENAQRFEFFPVLVKLIEAADSLSVQVHPKDEWSLKTEGQVGKNEAWIVLEAEKDAYLYYGLKKSCTKNELREMIKTDRLLENLNRVEVKKGDIFMVDAGTIHAIGKGCLIAEVQQNSNVTYRLYDYHRKNQNGKERPLHIEKGIQVADTVKKEVIRTPKWVAEENGNKIIHAISHDSFQVDLYQIQKELSLTLSKKSFQVLVVVSGSLNIQGELFEKGESAFIPAEDGQIHIIGKGELLTVSV